MHHFNRVPVLKEWSIVERIREKELSLECTCMYIFTCVHLWVATGVFKYVSKYGHVHVEVRG